MSHLVSAATLERLRYGDHLCVPYRRPAEQHTLAADFTAHGLRNGHKMFLAVNAPKPLCEHLTARVAGADDAFASGQLEVVSSREAYLEDGTFDPDRILDGFLDRADAALDEGYPGLRVIGDLSGLYPTVSGDTLVDYEARANAIYVEKSAMAICQYDPGTLDASTWRRLRTVHPGGIQESESGGDPVSRLRCRRTPTGVRLIGEADCANGASLPNLLAAAVHQPGPCEIDAARLGFVDGRAAANLLRAAADRGERPTTIICTGRLAKLLAIIGAADVPNLTVNVLDRP